MDFWLCSGIYKRKNKEGQTLFLVYFQISIDFYLDLSSNPPCSSSSPHYLLAWSAPFFLLPIHRNQLSSNVSTFTTSLTRARFEELYQDIFCSTPDAAEEVLCDSKIDKSNVPEIDLVSATRILVSSNLFPTFHRQGTQQEHQPWWGCCLSWVPQSKPPSSAPTL